MVGEILVDELTKSELLYLGEGIYWAKWRGRSVVQFDLVVVRASRGQGRALALAEDVQVVDVDVGDGFGESVVLVVRRVELGGRGTGGSGGGVDEAGKEDGGIVGRR